MDLRVFLLVVGVPTAGSLRQPARAGRSRSGSIRCAVSRAGPRLLLVDEADSMRNALQRYFEQRGFRCDAVATGHAALEMMARAPPPDVLITEVLISPESVDGLDLLHAVRADPRLCGTPVVLLTTRGLTSDRVAGFSAGASAYVSKPFDAEELVAIVRALAQNAMLARGALVGNLNGGGFSDAFYIREAKSDRFPFG